MREFRLPSLGSDMEAGKLLKWLVQPGDAVRRGQILAVVDTAKAAVDIESWEEGRLAAQVVQPGSTVPVGTVLGLIAAPGETVDEQAVARTREAVARTLRERADLSPMAAASTPGAAISEAPVAALRDGLPAVAGTAVARAAGRRRSSPAARRRAEELGIDLDAVAGTGPDGALTLEDVMRAGQAKAEADVPSVPSVPGVPAISAGAAEETPAPPLTPARAEALERTARTRQAIAAAMSRSKREIPHYYLTESIPLLHASQWLEGENLARPMAKRLIMAVLLLKAVARAVRAYPDFNGFYRDGAFHPAGGIHVGVAISLRQGGLVAPALHDVDTLSLSALMAGMTDLVARARSGSLRSSEMADPTITVTNLGDRGVEAVQGVIYPPQVALVGFGRVDQRVWVREGAMQIVPMVTATVAADHRVSDGHRGARFLAEIARLLQAPEAL